MSTDYRPDPPARLDELLALEATRGLPPTEASELDALLAEFPAEDADAFARAAAAVHLALLGPTEPLPQALAEKLELAAVAFFPPRAERRGPRVHPAEARWAGWAVAAALAGVLAFVVLTRPAPKTAVEVEQALQAARDRQDVLERELAEVRRLAARKAEPTAAQRRDQLQKDATAVAFTGKRDGVVGELVWSGPKQEGYLEVRGLPPLDATKHQYQLWIVDAGRPGSKPVDGGVFDVRPDGTALVRVRNPIAVRNAAAFAITREAAGGVVVSEAPQHELLLEPKQG